MSFSKRRRRRHHMAARAQVLRRETTKVLRRAPVVRRPGARRGTRAGENDGVAGGAGRAEGFRDWRGAARLYRARGSTPSLKLGGRLPKLFYFIYFILFKFI